MVYILYKYYFTWSFNMVQLTDDTEAERYRKILLIQASEIEMLKKQLAQETDEKYGYIKRIAELLKES